MVIVSVVCWRALESVDGMSISRTVSSPSSPSLPLIFDPMRSPSLEMRYISSNSNSSNSNSSSSNGSSSNSSSNRMRQVPPSLSPRSCLVEGGDKTSLSLESLMVFAVYCCFACCRGPLPLQTGAPYKRSLLQLFPTRPQTHPAAAAAAAAALVLRQLHLGLSYEGSLIMKSAELFSPL